MATDGGRGIAFTAGERRELRYLEAEAADLEAAGAREVLYATNAGTHDVPGGDYRLYRRVGDGAERAEGRDPAGAPGYRRAVGKAEFEAAARAHREARRSLDLRRAVIYAKARARG